MRKWNSIAVIVVLCTIALIVSGWNDSLGVSSPRYPQSSSTPKFLQTASGSHLGIPPYRLAGLGIGQTPDQVRASLGKADEERGEQWEYQRDGARLDLTFWEGSLLSVKGSGRWTFEGPDGALPGWMNSRSQVESALGEPTRFDGKSIVYESQAGELVLRMKDDLLEQIEIVGRTKYIATSHPPVGLALPTMCVCCPQ